MKDSKSLNIQWIGFTLVIGTLLAALTESIEYILSYRALTDNQLDIFLYDILYETTVFTMIFFVNFVAVCLLFIYFLFSSRQENAQKIYKIGFIGTIISLVFHIINIILFIIARINRHHFLITRPVLISQLTFGIFYFLSYLFVLICLWRIIILNYANNKFQKIMLISIILFGVSTFLIVTNPMFILITSNFPGRMKLLTFGFFRRLFYATYDILAIAAGIVIVFVTRSNQD